MYLIINLVFIFIILLLNIILFIIKPKKKKLIENKSANYAILIPARDESKVIDNTLASIKKQNKNMSNTYIIIESKKDPAYKIASDYGASVYVRKKGFIQTKGSAIDECIKDIFKNGKHYDLYFILDADNEIEANFIKNMLNYWKKGYEVASSYRNTSNPRRWVSICSGLLFSAQNNMLNKYRKLFNQAITLCGSGFYIDGRIIDDLGGFPFYSLTEDFELLAYMEYNNISNIYAEDGVYYDEQPTNIKDSINQRTRWLKGIFSVTKKREKNLVISIFNAILSIIAIFLMVLALELLISYKFLGLLFIYIIMMLLTFIALIFDRGKINSNLYQKLKCIIFNPIFLLSYIICLLKVLFKRNIRWDKTEHIGN